MHAKNTALLWSSLTLLTGSALLLANPGFGCFAGRQLGEPPASTVINPNWELTVRPFLEEPDRASTQHPHMTLYVTLTNVSAEAASAFEPNQGLTLDVFPELPLRSAGHTLHSSRGPGALPPIEPGETVKGPFDLTDRIDATSAQDGEYWCRIKYFDDGVNTESKIEGLRLSKVGDVVSQPFIVVVRNREVTDFRMEK